MQVRRFFAWLVLAAGMSTLIATSDDGPDDSWEDTQSASTSLHSAGRSDDMVVRVTLRRTGELAQRPVYITLSVSAQASRPASDVRIDWLPIYGADSRAAAADAAAAAPSGPDATADDAQVTQPATLDSGATDGDIGTQPAPGLDHAANGSEPIFSEGFTVLRSVDSNSMMPPCGDGGECSVVREVRFRVETQDPIDMVLTLSAQLQVYISHHPQGAVTMSLDVPDVP